MLIKDISFSYTKKEKQLQNIQTEIPLGKITTIIGPNGSGKSTFIQLIARLYFSTEDPAEPEQPNPEQPAPEEPEQPTPNPEDGAGDVELEDGMYQIGFQVLKNGTDEISVMDSYTVKPAKGKSILITFKRETALS